MKTWTADEIRYERDREDMRGDIEFYEACFVDAEIARLTKLRALDEQQFAKLKASFDEVVKQRDDALALVEAAALTRGDAIELAERIYRRGRDNFILNTDETKQIALDAQRLVALLKDLQENHHDR